MSWVNGGSRACRRSCPKWIEEPPSGIRAEEAEFRHHAVLAVLLVGHRVVVPMSILADMLYDDRPFALKLHHGESI